MSEQFLALEILERIERTLVKGQDMTKDDADVRYVLGRKDFAKFVEKHGAIPAAPVAVKQIEMIAAIHDIDAETLAIAIQWDEEKYFMSFLSPEERSPFNRPNDHRWELLRANDTPRWKRLTRQREERLDKAFEYFRSISQDVCGIGYDKLLPSADDIIKRCNEVAIYYDVDPRYLIGEVQHHFLSEWKIMNDRKEYVYHGIRRYFQGSGDKGVWC